jgi:hypothetical protein
MTSAGLPDLVLAADWRVAGDKRWTARAVLQPGGSCVASPPEPVMDVMTLLTRVRDHVGRQDRALLTFDFPIGLPKAYGVLPVNVHEAI